MGAVVVLGLGLADALVLALIEQGIAHGLRGDHEQLATSVAEAYSQIRPLNPGPAVNQLRAELHTLVLFLERVAPAELARKRAAGLIPR